MLYIRHNDATRGQVELWIDEGDPITLDAYWTETWGPATRFIMIAEGLEEGEHLVHIRMNGENTGEGGGNLFEIVNICTAGK